MKKKNFLFLALGGALFALTSCSSDDTVASNLSVEEANTINFRALNNEMTRATSVDISNLAQFTVDAYKTGTFASTPVKYFGDVVFKKNVDPATTYTSDTKYFWPSDYNLDFFAYGYASTINTGITKDASNQFTVITSADPDDQVDLVYARSANWGKATGAASGHVIPTDKTGAVLNFRHAESQIVVKLKNTNSNLKFTVNKVLVGNVWDRGQVTITDANTDAAGVLSSATWNTSIDAAMKVNYDVEATAASVITTEVAAGKSLILIPQTLPTPATSYEGAGDPKEYTKPYILVDLKIQNNAAGGDDAYIIGKESGDGEYVRAMWPIPAIAWAPGQKYTYTVDLSGGGYYPKNHTGDDALDPILENAVIKFVEVTVDEWGDGGTTIIDAPSVAVGTDKTIDIPATAGKYIFQITGCTDTPTATYNTGASFPADPAPAMSYASNVATFTFSVEANETGADKVYKIVLTDGGATGKTSTITINQAH